VLPEHCAGQQAALLADLAAAPFTSSLVLPPMQALHADDGLPGIHRHNVRLPRVRRARSPPPRRWPGTCRAASRRRRPPRWQPS